LLVQCQICGAGVSDSARTCPKCASDPEAFLGTVVECKECGSDYQPAYPECRSCGAIRSVAAPDQIAKAKTRPMPDQVVSAYAQPDSMTEATPDTASPAKSKQGGTLSYVLTFFLANIVVNGMSTVTSNSMVRGRSFYDLVSIESQFQMLAVGVAVALFGYACIYGVSRALTRIAPVKALVWLIFSSILGALLAIGQVYGALVGPLGVNEARLIAFQSGVFTMLGNLITLTGFWLIFRKWT